MRALLEIIRLPALFTAWADVVLGYVLTHDDADFGVRFVATLVASSGLYLSGMVWNDVFDVEQDTRERPHRPIPSGRIVRSTAVGLASALMAIGLAASAVAGLVSICMGLLLVVAILAYDGLLKKTPVAPLIMGSCRTLNILLGASGVPWEDASFVFRPVVLAIAISMGVYIAGVTWFARHEASESPRAGLVTGLVVMNFGVAGLVATVINFPADGRPQLALMLLLLIAVSLNGRGIGAVGQPSPAKVQGLVKLFLLNYVSLAASMIYYDTGNGALALGTALLVLPAMYVGRLISMT